VLAICHFHVGSCMQLHFHNCLKPASSISAPLKQQLAAPQLSPAAANSAQKPRSSLRAASKTVGPQYVTLTVTLSCPNLPKHTYGCWQVYFPCWNSSAEIVDWMAARGQGRTQDDFLQLWADYQSTALRTLDEEVGNSNTPIILWSSHLTQPDIIETFLSKDR